MLPICLWSSVVVWQVCLVRSARPAVSYLHHHLNTNHMPYKWDKTFLKATRSIKINVMQYLFYNINVTRKVINPCYWGQGLNPRAPACQSGDLPTKLPRLNILSKDMPPWMLHWVTHTHLSGWNLFMILLDIMCYIKPKDSPWQTWGVLPRSYLVIFSRMGIESVAGDPLLVKCFTKYQLSYMGLQFCPKFVQYSNITVNTLGYINIIDITIYLQKGKNLQQFVLVTMCPSLLISLWICEPPGFYGFQHSGYTKTHPGSMMPI